ncbi:MAG: DegT/DnrJ/EryC1/StrS aminotransferase family protein [Myxococcota bacterium]
MSTRLAIDGGDPVRRDPWPRWPHFDVAQIDEVTAVLRSGRVNYWTGDRGRSFERAFAKMAGCAHGIAVANGTVALELSLRAAGIGPGHEVIVPTRTFAGTATAVLSAGAKPVFADVDPHTQGLSRDTVQARLSPRTRAVIAVHLGGWPCAMTDLRALTRQHDLQLVEDGAQAHGARLGGEPVGHLGDIAAFSCCQDKIISTGGEGGVIVTDDEALAREVWSLKDHGKSYAAVYKKQHPPGFRWLHEGPGTNARMTEMQSALGLAQLERLPPWLEQRRRHGRRMTEALASHPAVEVPVPRDDEEPAYYRFYAFVRPQSLREGWTRGRIMQAITAEGVPCFVGSCGQVHREIAFAEHRPETPLPVAARLEDTSLAWLVHPTLEDTDIDDALAATHKVLAEATA